MSGRMSRWKAGWMSGRMMWQAVHCGEVGSLSW